ncbi:Peptidase S41 family protein ustP [Pseudocercospora fuligena]|uniref:Peptidase S41 family protein ustP n=1 Tax=Pseudocercospora fuligena TaxID=685502 RepID=A0A8H6VMU2_9PEZI|nr:Peptidase S41 family protein ustP [Pseudocercospora fuligena]
MRFTLICAACIAIATASPHWPDDEKPKDAEYWKDRWSDLPKVYTPALPSLPTKLGAHPPELPTTTSTTTGATNTTTTGPITTSATPTTSAPCNNACCSIRNIALLSSKSGSSLPTATPTVPAELAYECITSVKFNQSAAVALLDSLRPYLEWQSTIQWVKDPPEEYAKKVQEPYDFWSEFNRIYAKAKGKSYSTYANEHEFGFELYRAFQKSHDGHFYILPDSVGYVFSFFRTTPLVSVSEDGDMVPQIYAFSDVLECTAGTGTYTPSPITHIDGRDSHEFLLEWSQYGSLQDRDALWNNMFYLLQAVSLGNKGTGLGTFAGGGRGRWIYPGPSTTLKFKNGTQIVNKNFARVLQEFNNITSPEDVYRNFFAVRKGDVQNAYQLAASAASSSTSSTSTASATSSTSTTEAATPVPAPGYPKPVVRQQNNLNGGYYIEEEGYKDVAVLSVASFVGGLKYQKPFQAVNTYFIEKAANDSKTKLIIDVSANAGGTILQGYDLFKQLFPALLPYGANRFRAHEAFDLIGQEVSRFSDIIGNRSLDSNDTVKYLQSSAFDYHTDVDVNYTSFTSWPDKYSPAKLGPAQDTFTGLIRWNLSDVLTTKNSGGIVISGYLNRTNITKARFKAENIVILTDGYCASTCTIFSELMRQQAGVRTINLGGRPNRDITQAVGGVKGTNNYDYGYTLGGLVTIPFTYKYVHSEDFYNKSALAKYDNLPMFRTIAPGINVRDGYRQNDTSNIPLHFQYEPADCRIYYTPAMAVDQTAAWKTVADAAWNDGEHCIAGSMKKSLTYGGKPPKRDLRKNQQHKVRSDLDVEEHYKALREVWTGRFGATHGGNGIMRP